MTVALTIPLDGAHCDFVSRLPRPAREAGRSSALPRPDADPAFPLPRASRTPSAAIRGSRARVLRACSSDTCLLGSILLQTAGVVELANTPVLGAGARESLRVRIPPPALMLAHWDEVEGIHRDKSPMGATWQRLGDAAGAQGIGVNRVRIEPGRLSTPPHSH